MKLTPEARTILQYQREELNPETSRRVDEIIKEHMKSTGLTYSEALKDVYRIMREDPTQEPANFDEFSVEDGIEVDKVARGLQETKGISYRQAYREALLANPILAKKYTGHAVRPGGFREVYQDAVSELQAVANLVLGVPRNSDHSVNFPRVLQVLKAEPELCAAAARERIEELAKQWVSQQGLGPNRETWMPDGRRAVRGRYPGLGATADNGANVTREALIAMLPHLSS